MIRNVKRKAEISFDLPGCRRWFFCNAFSAVQSFFSFQWASLMIRRPDIHLQYQVMNATGHSGIRRMRSS